ncbi:MAG: hypothetical protein ABI743_12835, partial [bacterium]
VVAGIVPFTRYDSGMRWLRLIAVLLLAATTVGCNAGRSVKPVDCQKLARRLQLEGIAWDQIQEPPIPNLPGRQWDENVMLSGPGLNVELYRIDATKPYQDFLANGTNSGQVIGHEPFVVVVKQEPSPGAVKAAMEAIWGE